MLSSRLPGFIFLCLFLGYGYFAQQIQLDFWAAEESVTARTFPLLIAAGGSIVSLLYCLFPVSLQVQLNGERARTLILLMIVTGYTLALEPLGFLFSTTLLLALGSIVLGEARWRILAGVSILTPLGIYVLMQSLGIHLPQGVFAW